jgi:hypothetical protein
MFALDQYQQEYQQIQFARPVIRMVRMTQSVGARAVKQYRLVAARQLII